MANQAGLRRIIRVGIGTGKAQGGIPSIGSRDVLGAEGGDLRFGGQAGSVSRGASVADVDELVADAVGDDIRVERFLLAFVDQRVNGLKGEFRVSAPI